MVTTESCERCLVCCLHAQTTLPSVLQSIQPNTAERKTYYKTLKKIQFSDGDMTQ